MKSDKGNMCVALIDQHVLCTWRAEHRGQLGAQGGHRCLRQVYEYDTVTVNLAKNRGIQIEYIFLLPT